MRALTRFESEVGKRLGIVHFGQPWMANRIPNPFPIDVLPAAHAHGVIPMVDWSPWDVARNGNAVKQPRFALRQIIAGKHDELIRAWAGTAASWGQPLLLRLGHEMNGAWYPWAEGVNGNRPGEFVRAWRHVHRLFREEGARNVIWVWSVNAVYPGSTPLKHVFPGSKYVDWVAMSAYNFGLHPSQPGHWRSFAEVVGPTYRLLRRLAPRKPVMLSEFASTEVGGNKASWIQTALSSIAHDFPAIRAAVWFNWNAGGFDWSIDSSTASANAFRSGISAPVFADGSLGFQGRAGKLAAPVGC